MHSCVLEQIVYGRLVAGLTPRSATDCISTRYSCKECICVVRTNLLIFVMLVGGMPSGVSSLISPSRPRCGGNISSRSDVTTVRLSDDFHDLFLFYSSCSWLQTEVMMISAVAVATVSSDMHTVWISCMDAIGLSRRSIIVY